MRQKGVDALLLLGTSAVQYVTGAPAQAVDASRAILPRPVVLMLVDDPQPHLMTPCPEAAGEASPTPIVIPRCTSSWTRRRLVHAPPWRPRRRRRPHKELSSE
jgi:hypothetical protein